MVATFFDELFKLGDKVKKEEGVNSVRYKTIHEVADLLQTVYDQRNRMTERFTGEPRDKTDATVFGIQGIKVETDGEAHLHYVLDGYHFETGQEVIDYLIEDRQKHYLYMTKMYDSMFARAIEESANRMFNRGCAEFHEYIDANKPKMRHCQFTTVKTPQEDS